MAQQAPAGPRAVLPQQVSASAWFVQGDAALGSPANRNFISNAGFIVTPAGVVVIDALGSPQLARDLLAQIARITPQPVTHVVVTHYHADHVYGLQEFRKHGARIVAHRAAIDYIQSDTAAQRLRVSRTDLAPWIDDSTELVVPDQWIDGATELVVGGRRIALQPVGPAHTPEDIVVFLPDEGVLFAGDLVFRGRVPFVGQADSRQWIAALESLLKLQPKVVAPGHGALSTTARDDLQLTRDYLVYLREKMGEAAREMEPFDEAYARTDWSRFEQLPLFRAANRMNAYNTYLLMERQGR
ncbi:MBL fold metallo-hydrolase [Ramlibacter albus]|uniref:MBL fold metallo-hydrolase n=1 Tax=Ramlibacter albus TaxID=2079448 RepID=A0A923M8J3_9BURK|nr:MBL fold metallo-hydrolase [Ramlibacter albus]MBC5765798.1 MBL fold metallo-hydrolase [Ramlibacter albus]